MSFKIKTVFWGMLLGSLLSASVTFSQVVQVVPISSPGQASGNAPEGGSAPPPSAIPQAAAVSQTQPPSAQPSSSASMPLPAGAYPVPTAPPGGQAAGMPSTAGPSPALTPAPIQSPSTVSETPSVGRPIYGQPTAPQGQGEELSPFEQFVSGKIPQTISFDIKQFGYDLFISSAPASQLGNAPISQGMPPLGTTAQGTALPAPPQGVSGQAATGLRLPSLATPSTNVPVGPDYVIAPGDETRISVWGSVEGTWSAVVDRDGNISLPKVGTLGVTGLNFQQLRELLFREVSKYYKDFEMSVTMGQLRTMTVYVVGNDRAPGAYSVPSLSTIINVLMMAGGPSKTGTMRDIQVKRNGETIARLDLYDFLISGDKSKDQRLLPEDVIFVPPIGPIVGVAGNVDRPAIYELKGKTLLSEAIKLAGGVTAAAYLQRVQVERVFQRQTKIIVDVNLDKFKGKLDIPLQDGDIVKVFPIVPLVTNKVVLQGNVRRPGEYEWKAGMRAKDLLPSVQSLLPETFLNYALITRLVPPDYHQEYRSFDLEAVLIRNDSENNILLDPYDIITVYNKWDVIQREKVRITGAVNKPGEFEFRPNMKLSDLLKLGGGFRKFAYTSKAELTRVTPMDTGPLTELISVNAEEALAGNPEHDVVLQENDYLFVRAVPDWHLYQKVTLTGEVKFPGDYALKKAERLSSLFDRAGGFTDKAYTRGAVLTRLSVKDNQQKQLNDMVAKLERELLAISSADVAGSADANDAQILVTETKQKQVFLSSLKQIQATGRMVVNVEEARRLRNSALDIEMEDGDVLNIPLNPQTIQVIGAVNSQANFVYEPTKDYAYYVDRAGGFSRTADKGELYIVKVDGSTIRPGGGLFWNTSAHQWESGSQRLIEPGDTIVVPEQLERIAWLRNLKDWTQILYQSALGAAVVVKVFQ
jgi:protein involved in polysaccharide export with SLBB domain